MISCRESKEGHPSPLRLPCARCEGRLSSIFRSRASYDCLMMDLRASGPLLTEYKLCSVDL